MINLKILKKTSKLGDIYKTVNLLNIAAIFFSIILSTRLGKDLLTFKINSSDILFHCSSRGVYGEPIFSPKTMFSHRLFIH